MKSGVVGKQSANDTGKNILIGRRLSPDAAVVLGRWRLARANDEPHGRFTLIFRRMPEGWRIVHDHTSAAKD